MQRICACVGGVGEGAVDVSLFDLYEILQSQDVLLDSPFYRSIVLVHIYPLQKLHRLQKACYGNTSSTSNDDAGATDGFQHCRGLP